MSGKIKAKDLSYDPTLPTFLQKLHAQNTGRGDADRHERPIARPRKDKNADDDEPTVVDENGEIISTHDRQELLVPVDKTGELDNLPHKGSEKSHDRKAADVTKVESRKMAENITNGAAVKKRKIAKAIGDDTKRDAAVDEKGKASATQPVMRRNKAKKIRLAFDDQDPL